MVSQIIRGLQIAMNHAGNKYLTAAEHDVLYVNVPTPLPEADQAEMLALGWFDDDASIVDGERVGPGEGTCWGYYT